ncbi:hypothetical protein HH214_21345 [Mucilaginibacter robiniae]|uniref:DUF4919 domain-containing protein n=1 Tax=Mucilaginibacter robiniae TaxID=2728022 RepID=A0A7L5E4J1_9SPHI|nr:DUF6624 domain-containing protein [Mucilaginibacter robiniae]QJD98240.1 hypothetical protein HH214_21345 [Mucilaginibacter robiniae]
MKSLLITLLCFTGLIAQAQNPFNSTLKKQLDSVMILDQKYRDTLTWLMTPDKVTAITKSLGISSSQAINYYSKLQKNIDSANTVFVEAIFNRYGYPGKSLVGDSTSEAAWYVIQHSKKIDNYIPVIKKAAEAHELTFRLYAMLLDRYLMNNNQEQVYGSQMSMRTLKATQKNEWIVWPIKDPKRVNALRKKAGFKDTVEDNAANLDVKYKVIRLDEIVM